jgi:nucleotide-binding universal stress UspA family protein
MKGELFRSRSFQLKHSRITHSGQGQSMNKFTQKTVIVPWDFSPLSKSALEAALEMVDSPDKIKVIHVTPYPAATEYGMVWGLLTETDIQGNLVKSFQQEMRDCNLPEVEFTAEFGDPGSRIADFAKTKDAGLVVISSHGHTGLSRLFLGSVAERVVRLSPCPVLVLRGHDEAE